MQKATFKIRRKIILAFLFSLLSVLIFSVFSLQVHREIGHRLRLLELTNDLFQTILELRRVEIPSARGCRRGRGFGRAPSPASRCLSSTGPGGPALNFSALILCRFLL